jgi:hypothetical protein
MKNILTTTHANVESKTAPSLFSSGLDINNNNITSFQLKDIPLNVTNRENADVTITLDYINGVNASDFKKVGIIADTTKGYLTNYPYNPNYLFEVINRNLASELLTDSNLGLSKVLDSLSINLDVEPKIIPFQFDNTVTRTANGNINDIVSFNLQDVTSPIDGGIVTDVTVNLDYIDGIDPSGFKDVIPLANYVKDYLTHYFNPNDSLEVVNNNLGNALLTDFNLGLSEVLDSLTVTLDTFSPGVIPFSLENIVTFTPLLNPH